MDDEYHVAIITPVIHYCMGGVAADEKAQVLSDRGVIQGLYVAGEAMGGVHGSNRLGGSSLLDCVVFGRIAGREAAKCVGRALMCDGCAWRVLPACWLPCTACSACCAVVGLGLPVWAPTILHPQYWAVGSRPLWSGVGGGMGGGARTRVSEPFVCARFGGA